MAGVGNLLRQASCTEVSCNGVGIDPRPNAGCSCAERVMPLERYRNIGIMAHIDAGKVTYPPCPWVLLDDCAVLLLRGHHPRNITSVSSCLTASERGMRVSRLLRSV